MSEQNETVDMITISLPQRLIGVDMAEVEKTINDFDPDRTHAPLLARYREKKAHIRLSDFLHIEESQKDNAAIIVHIGETDQRLVTFHGLMTKKPLALSRIKPVTKYIRHKQQPFVVWGFGEEATDEGKNVCCMLVTFQFLEERGSS